MGRKGLGRGGGGKNTHLEESFHIVKKKQHDFFITPSRPTAYKAG